MELLQAREVEYTTRTKIKRLLDIEDSNKIKSDMADIIRELWKTKCKEFKHDGFYKVLWDFTLYLNAEGDIQVTNLENLTTILNSDFIKIMMESESFQESLNGLSSLCTKLDSNSVEKDGYIEVYLTIPIELSINASNTILKFKYPSKKDVEFFLKEYVLWIRSEAFTAYRQVFGIDK